MKTIGAAIATASPETWKTKREADLLVIYILSGGSLADVGPLLKGDAVLESERSLARARSPTSPITRPTRSLFFGKRI